MTVEQTNSIHMERYSAAIQGDTGGIRGVATPYGVPNGRPGRAWQIDGDGYPEIVSYEGTVWEPGVFSEWLAEGNARRVRFLFQHGDAGESWAGSPFGANALPIGTINALTETENGLEFDASFASNELAKAVQELVRTGALEEVSIAFGVTEFDLRTGADGKVYRHATAAQLYDVSVVVWGQYGLNATVTELYNAAPHARATVLGNPEFVEAAPEFESVVTALRVAAEHYAGAAISKANAETLTKAVTDLRSAATSLTDHADAIEATISATSDGSEDGDEQRADTTPEHARAEITDAQRLYMADLEHREREI